MFCEKCGKPNDDDAMFCEYCGAPMNEPAPVAPPPAAPQYTAPVQPPAPPAPVQPLAPVYAAAVPEPKKRGKGSVIAAIIAMAVVVIFAVAVVLIFKPWGLFGGSSKNKPSMTVSGKDFSIEKSWYTTAILDMSGNEGYQVVFAGEAENERCFVSVSFYPGFTPEANTVYKRENFRGTLGDFALVLNDADGLHSVGFLANSEMEISVGDCTPDSFINITVSGTLTDRDGSTYDFKVSGRLEYTERDNIDGKLLQWVQS